MQKFIDFVLDALKIGAFFVLMLVVVVWLKSRKANKREKQFRALADRLGLEFADNDAFDLPETYSDMKAFADGDARRGCNQLHGEWQKRRVVLMDYSYDYVDSRKRTCKFCSTYCLVFRETDLPGLQIRPEGLLDKVGVWAGYKEVDVQMISDEFDSAFHVSAEDERFAREILTHEMMDFLLQHKKVGLELHGKVVLASFGRELKIDKAEELLYATMEIAERLPS